MIFCSTDRKTYCKRPQVATVKKESLTSVLFARKLVESLINANKISSELFFTKIFVKCSTPVAVGSSTFFGSVLLKYVEFFMIKYRNTPFNVSVLILFDKLNRKEFLQWHYGNNRSYKKPHKEKIFPD